MSDETKPRDMYRTQTLRAWPDTVMTRIDETTVYKKEEDLKYGTNPHHAAAIFSPEGNTPLFVLEKSGKGGPSQTNYEDVDRALRIVNSVEHLTGNPVAVVMKHVNPTGVAAGETAFDAVSRAWDCDFRAAYGGTVAVNTRVDGELLARVYEHIKRSRSDAFIDVLVAPSLTEDALDVVKSKSIRVFRYDEKRLTQIDPFAKASPEMKQLSDGRLIVSEPYVEAIRTPNDLKAVTSRTPNAKEFVDMVFAWYVAANTRSNGVVFARDLTTVAVGTGKQERIDAIEDAIRKAEFKAAARGESDCLRGAVLASDGFVPNKDNIPPLRDKGVVGIIQPGGSSADDGVISACEEAGIAMVFTNWRCFSHH